jgi:hypothetical protein
MAKGTACERGQVRIRLAAIREQPLGSPITRFPSCTSGSGGSSASRWREATPRATGETEGPSETLLADLLARQLHGSSARSVAGSPRGRLIVWGVAEKPNERLARHIVSTTLGLPVTRYEDGTADSQVDALIHGSEGAAVLEIVADHEASFNAQWDALERVGHRVEVPGLRRAWSAQLARRSKVNGVVKALPLLMRRLEGQLNDARRPRDLPEALTRLGIKMLYPLDDDKRSGYVNLHPEGWGGFASSETMGHYVERILANADDVPSKLAKHAASEKHAFIWTTIGTDYGIQFQLERRDQPLPKDPPRLPQGVTHVWVVGSFTSQGAVAWFPDRGWWRPDWAWPEDHSLALGEE